MSIILDFDGTVTEKDTINVLAGYFTGLSARKQETWQEIVDLYLQSIYDLEMQYRPPVEARRDLQEELDYLQAIRRCESDSIGRVEKSRIFDRAELGLTPKNHQDGMYELGQMTVKTGTVRVRAGFQHFLQNLLDREWKIGVLSLNWSSDFVKGTMSTVDTRALSRIKYCTNNISWADGKVVGPTPVHPVMLTGGDKKKCWAEIFPRSYLPSAVYIGDGITDLECLLSCSRGIVMVNNPDKSYLLHALRRIGYEVDHASQVRSTWRFCWAANFQELVPLFQGEGPKSI